MHSAPVSADILMNFCISLFKNLRHLFSNKTQSQVNFLWLNICKYEMPNRESKESFTTFIFLRCLMHSLTILCTHFACVCADKLLNFHISLFQNLKHINSNKKPSLVNFLWINICKYRMPHRESKESFTKVIFVQMADAIFNYIMHPCILHLFLRIY